MAPTKRRLEARAKLDKQFVNVELDREVHRRLRLLSIDRKTPMSELIRNAVDAWLPGQAKTLKRGKE